MKKYFNSFGGFITAAVILLAAVIFENIKGALAVKKIDFVSGTVTSRGTSAPQSAPQGQAERPGLYPQTTPQVPAIDTSGIKKEIEASGLNPVPARFWKEVD